MKKKVLVWVIIITVIVSLVSLRIISARKGKYISVKTAQAVKGDIKSYLSTTAVIQSKNSVDYYGLQGKIKTVNIKIGDTVKQGDVLIAYESQDMSTAVQQAQLQYDNAVLNKQDTVNQNNSILKQINDIDNQIASLKKLNPKADVTALEQEKLQLKPVSDEKLQQLDNQIKAALLSLNQAKESQAKYEDKIIARSGGVVTALSAEEGASTSQAQLLVTVQDINNLKAVVAVGKYDAASIMPGQEAEIKNGNNTYKGKVSFIAPAAVKTVSSTGQDTTLDVEIDILDKAPDLKINFEADTDILIGQTNNILKVPAESIKTDKAGKSYVFIVKGNKAVQKYVDLGLQSDTEAQILSGISEGDRVILNPSVAVKDGALVK